ncbi:ribosome-binding factor A [Candidatus Peregrinibacteria bacterium CG08_land_8_20_14_0_20_41_10]|nr:MAG: ribosome-binding factor A [Candidatus Peregrinibacteria bacterium CG08_land_8_20_14_0_20_41_10]
MKERARKASSLIQVILSEAIHAEIDATSFGMITVRRVKVSDDLGWAKVFMSGLRNQEKLVETLNKRIYYLQGVVNRKLAMRKSPRLRFVLDDTAEYVEKIEKLIKKAKGELVDSL